MEIEVDSCITLIKRKSDEGEGGDIVVVVVVVNGGDGGGGGGSGRRRQSDVRGSSFPFSGCTSFELRERQQKTFPRPCPRDFGS